MENVQLSRDVLATKQKSIFSRYSKKNYDDDDEHQPFDINNYETTL